MSDPWPPEGGEQPPQTPPPPPPPPPPPSYGTPVYGASAGYGAPAGYAAPAGYSGAPSYIPPASAGVQRTNPLAVAALVTGILGCCGVLAIVAIVCGLVARNQIGQSGGEQKGEGLAVAGIALGAVWLLASLGFAVRALLS